MQVMISRVEQYIHERTGKKVTIVFNNMARFTAHFDMLIKAHEYVVNYKNTNK